jgi:hypothetical protein
MESSCQNNISLSSWSCYLSRFLRCKRLVIQDQIASSIIVLVVFAALGARALGAPILLGSLPRKNAALRTPPPFNKQVFYHHTTMDHRSQTRSCRWRENPSWGTNAVFHKDRLPESSRPLYMLMVIPKKRNADVILCLSSQLQCNNIWLGSHNA